MQVYTTQEVAEILKITPSSVIKLIKKEELKAKKIARKWRISENHLSEFMETNLNQ
ncbi:MAG: helix-turn-helix domain-containing protein [Halanaerobiales bacterium]|nr:helix-turn-helix domain-containing protein [Halanaerobiales bacterium]